MEVPKLRTGQYYCKLPPHNLGSLEMPQEEVAGDRQLEIYYKALELLEASNLLVRGLITLNGNR